MNSPLTSPTVDLQTATTNSFADEERQKWEAKSVTAGERFGKSGAENPQSAAESGQIMSVKGGKL